MLLMNEGNPAMNGLFGIINTPLKNEKDMMIPYIYNGICTE